MGMAMTIIGDYFASLAPMGARVVAVTLLSFTQNFKTAELNFSLTKKKKLVSLLVNWWLKGSK